MTFDALFKLIPDYLYQFLQLISDPKKYVGSQDLDSKTALNQSSLFYFSSVFFAYVVKVPFLSDAASYWETATVTAIIYIPSAVALGLLAFFSCKVVGGKGSLTAHVAVFSYFAGVSVIIYALFSMAAKGIIKAKLPDQFDLYHEYMTLLFSGGKGLDDAKFMTLENSQELLISMLVLMVGFLLIIGWLVSVWRIYRDLNAYNGLRNTLALLVFLFFGYGASLGLGYAQSAINVSVF